MGSETKAKLMTKTSNYDLGSFFMASKIYYDLKFSPQNTKPKTQNVYLFLQVFTKALIFPLTFVFSSLTYLTNKTRRYNNLC